MPPASKKPHYGQQLDGDQSQADAHDHGRGQPDQDGFAALLLGQGGGGQAHGHGVVAGQDQVDHEHLAERGRLADEFGIGEEVHARSLEPEARRAKTPLGRVDAARSFSAAR